MASERVVVIVDLEKDAVPVRFKAAKVMLFVWVIGMAKVVVDRDSLGDPTFSTRILWVVSVMVFSLIAV